MHRAFDQWDESERHAVSAATDWARQSLAFAMSIRDTDTAQQIDDDQSVQRMLNEAQRLTDDLWVSSRNACPEDAALPVVLTAYSRTVFDWCYKHMHYESGEQR